MCSCILQESFRLRYALFSYYIGRGYILVYSFFMACLHMDLMCLCLVSVKAIMFGFGYVCSRACRSMSVVCIPLVLRVRAVMAGWV